MMFESYDSYKDSGIEWLGDIPSEWTFCRFGDTFKVNKKKNNDLIGMFPNPPKVVHTLTP